MTNGVNNLLEKTFNEGLTCSELAYAIKCGDDHESNKGGRPLKIPASFDGMVQQQKKAAEEWERRNQKVWSPSHAFAGRQGCRIGRGGSDGRTAEGSFGVGLPASCCG